jgi:hypothetical protein
MPDDHHPLMPRRNPEDIDLGLIKVSGETISYHFVGVGEINRCTTEFIFSIILGATLDTPTPNNRITPTIAKSKTWSNLARSSMVHLRQFHDNPQERD